MPHEIVFTGVPAGRALSFAAEGEDVSVETCGFITTDDGSDFATFAEGLSGDLSAVFRPKGNLFESQVDHILAIIRKDGAATIYVNELQLLAEMRPKRAVHPGEEVRKNDVADILRLRLLTANGDPVSIPKDCGVEFLFSVGWRKGIYFDFSTVGPNAVAREYDIERTLGHLYGRLMFREFFSLPETAWDQLFDWGLFPFIALKTDDREALMQSAMFSRFPTALATKIPQHLCENLEARIDSWHRSPVIAPHMEFVRVAAKRFVDRDWISTIQVLFPRIEGVLRDCLKIVGPSAQADQANLAKHARVRTPDDSLLLPLRFERFLKRFYFKNFDTQRNDTPLSRNSIAHGVSNLSDYSDLAAATGLLILDQIFYYSLHR